MSHHRRESSVPFPGASLILRSTPTRRLLLILTLAALNFGQIAARGDEPALLARRVRPILARCVQCHSGEDAAGDLDLSTRDAALRGGESGAALTLADPAKSLLLRKVAARKMPPKEPLADDQIALVRDWINSGAVWESPIRAEEAPSGPSNALWALRPIARVSPPRVKDRKSVV